MKHLLSALFLATLFLFPHYGEASATGLKEVTDLQAVAREKTRNQRPLLLVFTADDCAYCEMLAEQILLPMLRSGEYDHRVEICALNLDGEYVRDFQGKSVEPWEFAQRYRVSVTPTMVLLNDRGDLLDKPMVGVRTLEFYEAFIAEAIERASKRLDTSSN